MDCLHPTRPSTVSDIVSYASPQGTAPSSAIPSAPVMAEGVWSTGLAAVALFGIVVMLVLLSGCESGPAAALFPNADPALRKSPTEFAADASRRQPYKADLPRGGVAPARASIDYAADTIQIVNLSDEDWNDVEVWVNKLYVVNVSRLDKGAPAVRTIRFEMLFDGTGKTFPTNNLDPRDQVHSVEILRDGKMYDVRLSLAD